MRSIFIYLLLSVNAWATPEHFEIWFITKPETSVLDMLIKRVFDPKEMKIVMAQNDVYNCKPMGDGYCFHPQLGVMEMAKPSPIQKPEMLAGKKKVQKDPRLMNALESDLISCDKGYYFDLYCGRSQENQEQVNRYALEVWIDTSMSMQDIDMSPNAQELKLGEECYRKSFVRRLQQTCGRQKLSVSVFDTRKDFLGGSTDKLCLNKGMNDQNRLMQWILQNKSKNLIIITDMNEYSIKLADFAHQHQGRLKGIEHKKEIYAKHFPELATSVAKYCR